MAIDSRSQTKIPPDGGWGWVVTAGSMLCTMMICIPGMTFGILLSDVIFAMDTKMATATWTMSILLGTSGLIAPLVTIALDYFSCRKIAIFGGLMMSTGLMLSSFAINIETLYITFGLFGGIAYGCNRVVAIVILGQYFKRRYGISMGLVMAGFSISRLLFSTVILFTKMTCGFRGTYLVMGATCLNICIGASLYQPAKWHYLKTADEEEAGIIEEKKPFKVASVDETTISARAQRNNTESILRNDSNHMEMNELSEHRRPSKDLTQIVANTCNLSFILSTLKRTLRFSLFRDADFQVILASQMLFQFVIQYSTVFLIPLSIDKGFNPLDAALVQTVKSLAEIGGRICFPWIVAMTNTNTIWTHIIINVANCLALIAHALVEDYKIFVATALMTGFLSGGILVQGVHLILITMGKDRFSAAIGLCSFMHSIFLLLGGPILGFIRDRTGTLVYSFLLLAVCQFVSGMVWTAQAFTNWTNKNRCTNQRTNGIN